MGVDHLSAAELYALVIGQLLDDGHVGAAHAVADATLTPIPLPAQLRPPPRELERRLRSVPKAAVAAVETRKLDLDVPAPEGGEQQTALRLTWSAPCAGKSVAFKPDGRQAAVGGADGKVSLLDVRAMLNRGGTPQTRTYTDHALAVNALEFHPTAALLVTGSEDHTMRFFETDRAVPRATRQCTDTHPVRSVSFHPLGDHLLVGTGHSALHVYDVATFRCYTAARPEDNHTAPITCARWSADGALFASCAADAIKLWDATSCQCARTIPQPHGKAQVRRPPSSLALALAPALALALALALTLAPDRPLYAAPAPTPLLPSGHFSPLFSKRADVTRSVHGVAHHAPHRAPHHALHTAAHLCGDTGEHGRLQREWPLRALVRQRLDRAAVGRRQRAARLHLRGRDAAGAALLLLLLARRGERLQRR